MVAPYQTLGLRETSPVMFNEEGTEPLLGAVALEEALLGIDPVGKRLVLMRGRV